MANAPNIPPIRVEVKWDKAALSEAYYRLENAHDKRGLCAVIAVAAKRVIQENFEAEGRTEEGGGKSWPAWSSGYILWRMKKKKFPGKILQLYGNLLRSLHTDSGEDWASVSASRIYAARHNFGEKMPKREFMMIPRPGWKYITDKAWEFINMRLNK